MPIALRYIDVSLVVIPERNIAIVTNTSGTEHKTVHKDHSMARIVVAMSGGVDSSVAAALLKEQGHEVIGMMLRLWSEPGVIEDDGVERVVQNKCCSLEAVDDARRVARMLDIPFYLVNVEDEFKSRIVDSFYEDYVAGRTPNPCL